MTVTLRKRCTLWLMMGSIVILVGAAGGNPENEGAKEAAKVADELDKFVQARFAKVDTKRFGGGRLVTVPAHPEAHALPLKNEEKKLIEDINRQGHAYQVAFFHFPHPKGNSGLERNEYGEADTSPDVPRIYPLPVIGGSRIGNLPRQEFEGTEEEKRDKGNEWFKSVQRRQELFKLFAAAELTALKQGKSRERTIEGWRVVLRPVRAMQEACVNCHAGAKRGETLGAVVYGVNEERNPPGKIATLSAEKSTRR
jgi:hypothetical protein